MGGCRTCSSFAQHNFEQVPVGELQQLPDQPFQSEKAPVLGCDHGRFYQDNFYLGGDKKTIHPKVHPGHVPLSPT